MTEALRPQIKVCGLTDIKEANGCAEFGVDAIGCVFFPKSPRHLSAEQAREICRNLPKKIVTVGVFVNASFTEIMRRVDFCGLDVAQLHGRESPDLVEQLRREKIKVIKALFVNGTPDISQVDQYRPSAYLVECGKGILPGGNALTWNWKEARDLGEKHPLVLAGGLSPENVAQAIADAMPAAVDVSSGVEAAPGKKDLKKVAAFVKAASEGKHIAANRRPVFSVSH